MNTGLLFYIFLFFVSAETLAVEVSLIGRSCRNVNSVAELQAVAGCSDCDVTMTPGTYWLTGPLRPSTCENYPIFLNLSGNRSTFDFTGVTIQVDTRELKGYGRKYGHGDTVRILQISGQNITVNGLTLEMVQTVYSGTDPYETVRQFTADWTSILVEITGQGTVLKNADMTTGGSYPYGYGDAFGKGQRPIDSEKQTNAAWIDHRKQSGVRMGRGVHDVTLENIVLHMRSFGHGFFMQEGAHGLHFKNCRVEGDEMADSNDIIAHPEYQKWGFATYGHKIPANIHISKQEDGFRVYGYSAAYGWVSDVTIENCTAERMRNGFSMGDMCGTLIISNSAAWFCESGFTPAHSNGGVCSNRIVDCRGDAVNGPLLFFLRSGDNVTASVELAGTNVPVGHWPIALISGSGNNITLTRSAPAGLYPADASVDCSQQWREWRHRPNPDIDDYTGGDNCAKPTIKSFIVNKTGQPLVLGVHTADTTGYSDGGVIDKGLRNTVSGELRFPSSTEAEDTWGSYRIWPGNLP